MKVVTAVRGGGSADPASLALGITERLARGAVTPGRRGLIVSEVLRRSRGELAFDAFVEEWLDDGADGGVPLAVLGPDLGVSRWVTTEHVLKRPVHDPSPTRVKVLGTAYRRHDFTTGAFFEYWRSVHGPISARVPGLGGYVVSEVLARLAGETAADGFVEQWWPDEATLDATATTPELEVAWADVSNYAQTTGTFWVTREHVLQAPAYPDLGILERP